MAAGTPTYDNDIAHAAVDDAENAAYDYRNSKREMDIVEPSTGACNSTVDASYYATSAVVEMSIGRLVRDVRRDERNDMLNRFLSIDMDEQVSCKQ